MNGLYILQRRSKEVKMLWNAMIQCYKEIETRRPDIIVVKRKERSNFYACEH